jgi:hypothetical protein
MRVAILSKAVSSCYSVGQMPKKATASTGAIEKAVFAYLVV